MSIPRCSLTNLVIILFLFGCSEQNYIDEPIIESSNRILPLGASRVEGDRPNFESFRFELWKRLKEDSRPFDFVGTQKDNTSYPDFNGENFDIDHEGRSGWVSEEILNNIETWLNTTGKVDVVLFSSPGGNDLLEGLSYENAIININGIIDIIQGANPDVTIIIEQMAPARSDVMTESLIERFEQMKQDVIDIADSQSTSTSRVIPVDMFSDFNDNYLADEVHYNEAGAVFIADRYLAILETVLIE